MLQDRDGCCGRLLRLFFVALFKMVFHPMHGDKGWVAVWAVVWPLPGVLAQVSHQGVFVAEPHRARRAVKLLLRLVDLK